MNINKLKKGSYIVHESQPCVIKDIKFLQNKNSPVAKLELEGIFSGKIYNTHLLMHENIPQAAGLGRKCATIVGINKDKLKIMDVSTFETFEAEISKELLSKAKEGDNITYIEFDGSAKVLEVRK
jgi:translation elongation factor P/translation initiation factor 5A